MSTTKRTGPAARDWAEMARREGIMVDALNHLAHWDATPDTRELIAREALARAYPGDDRFRDDV